MAKYEGDFAAWAAEQGRLLRAGRFSELDLANLAEEVESIGRRDADELENSLREAMAWMLRWHVFEGTRVEGWHTAFADAKFRAIDILADSPSLRVTLDEPGLWQHLWEGARVALFLQNGVRIDLLPESCPWTVDQLLDETFGLRVELLPTKAGR